MWPNQPRRYPRESPSRTIHPVGKALPDLPWASRESPAEKRTSERLVAGMEDLETPTSPDLFHPTFQREPLVQHNTPFIYLLTTCKQSGSHWDKHESHHLPVGRTQGGHKGSAEIPELLPHSGLPELRVLPAPGHPAKA